MTPRPRTVDDADILMAAWRAISRIGPARLTLADVAKEIGLSPATLVQRFGSKRGLLLALAEGSVGSVDACFAAARAAHPTPLTALLAAATELTRYTATPEEMSNHLAFLQIDLSDPDFHKHALENSKLSLIGYQKLLDEAVSAGELVPCDTARLARAIGATAGGSLIAWAIFREGTAEAWVLEDLATLIAPYRRAPNTRATSGKRARRRRPRKTRAKSRRAPARKRQRSKPKVIQR
jgi:AcrR family transcriptional regulator